MKTLDASKASQDLDVIVDGMGPFLFFLHLDPCPKVSVTIEISKG